ncbi:MAG TPA: DUF1461 domain-containing protein [Cellvibrio sp.]|nr:DUF1461 domain-containing protein [Cellvibrio sp.]
MNPDLQQPGWRKLVPFLFWPVFFISHLLAVSLLAWHLLAQINFAYPLGYTLLNISAQVQEFAPHNRYKAGFEQTTSAEHVRLFAEIVDAIQHHGKGLAEIKYTLPDGRSSELMHNAEIIHLQDVANLLDRLYSIGISAGIIWLILLAIAHRFKLSQPPLARVLLGSCIGLAVISIGVIGLGATEVFYWLHTQVFPEGHQWFFYYEESLMTTLMKAPDIFGFIALLLLGLIIILWAASIWASNRLLKPVAIAASPTPVAAPTTHKRAKAKRKK